MGEQSETKLVGWALAAIVALVLAIVGFFIGVVIGFF